MTRQAPTLAPTIRTDKRPRLAPLAPARNRTHDVVERIAGEIRAGKLAAGDRLPTEQEMVAAFKVSRTVVREALAALKADGLVTTRQGSGAYVANVTDLRPFRLRDEQLGAVESIADVLELRLAVEVEAASLAAGRATASAVRRVVLAHGRFTKAVERGLEAIEEDIAFHGAIAAATGNPQFGRFLAFLGGFLIPRQRVNLRRLEPEAHRAYMASLVIQHGAIVEAIVGHDPVRAAAAMREHLARAVRRYGKVSEG